MKEGETDFLILVTEEKGLENAESRILNFGERLYCFEREGE